jgi:nitrile hydratase accessory protein
MARSAWAEALAAVEKARQALEHLPPGEESGRSDIDLRFLKADVGFALGHHERLRAEIDSALKTAAAIADRPRTVQGLTRKAISHWMRGELLDNLAHAEQARAVADMDGPAALPRANGELVFAAPWESRVFGMAVALHDDAAYPWDEFRDRLIAEIARAEAAGEASTYYERWLAALERLLVERGWVDPAALDVRTAEIAACPPEADHH